MHVLLFAGSLRKESFNKKLAREAMRVVAEQGHSAEFLDLRDYAMPLYDADIENASGIPDATVKLGDKIRKADALIVSSPEYNGAISCVLKNTIDWLSREKEVSLEDKPLLLFAASPGALGGVRGLWHTRVPFEVLGMHVYPTMMGLPGAADAFDEQGRLKDEKRAKQLQGLVGKFLDRARKG